MNARPAVRVAAAAAHLRPLQVLMITRCYLKCCCSCSLFAHQQLHWESRTFSRWKRFCRALSRTTLASSGVPTSGNTRRSELPTLRRIYFRF